MTHGSLFSGIGGFDLAAHWMGWENLFHCELEEFPQAVLNYYFPNAKTHEDIRETDFNIYRGRIDVLSGGFPCQPYSAAGKKLGTEDDRDLWPEMLRAIREIQPRWIVAENVLGFTNWNGGMVFEQVQAQMEDEGYEVQSYILPAAGVGAPHLRYRTFIVAYSPSFRVERSGPAGKQIPQTSSGERLSGCYNAGDSWGDFPTVSPICRGDDGLSGELDGITFSKWHKESLKGFGNAIVPKVVYLIFKTIERYETRKTK